MITSAGVGRVHNQRVLFGQEVNGVYYGVVTLTVLYSPKNLREGVVELEGQEFAVVQHYPVEEELNFEWFVTRQHKKSTG